jgi:uncharacterized phiE125 gp8 family phage protein
VSKLTLLTAATERPDRTEDVAEWLRESDSTRFGIVSDLIDSAVATLQLEHWTQFCTATYTQYFDGWPSDRFLLGKNPVGTVASVKYTDSDGSEATVATSIWEQADENGRGIVRLKYDQSWPSDLRGHTDDIFIQYTCGHGTAAQVPAPIKQAIRLWVADSYAFAETVSPLRLSKAPRSIEALLAPYSYRTVS